MPALKDEQRTGRPATYTNDIRAVIINVACQKPKDLGLAQELWTITSLTDYMNSKNFQSQHTNIGIISRSSIQRTLQSADIKPWKIEYYCEKRDPEFDKKMRDVLYVYKVVQLQFDGQGNILGVDEQKTVTLSFDEKPGIQAIATTVPDLLPTPEYGNIKRDYEYKRLGTVSLLAAIDLLSGKAIPLVRDTHNSEDFIDFLNILNESYDDELTIRIVLDNLRVHTSKKVQEYLATIRDGRFMFVFTPKHGSWLNLVESFFSKMTRQMLRGIRVASKAELVERIYRYFDEINSDPVVFRWKYKLDDIKVV
jgi:transposase